MRVFFKFIFSFLLILVFYFVSVNFLNDGYGIISQSHAHYEITSTFHAPLVHGEADTTTTMMIPHSQVRRFNILNNTDVNNLMKALFYHIEKENLEKIRDIYVKLTSGKLDKEVLEVILSESFLQAALSDHKRVMKVFKGFGADVNIGHIETELTALHIFVSIADEEGVRYLLNQKDINVNVRDIYGNTPLHHSVIDSIPPLFEIEGDPNKNILELLIAQKDIDINAVNSEYESALLIAIKERNRGAVKTLLAHKEIDIKTQDRLGWGGAHIATLNEDLEMIKLLLDHGLNPNEETRNGKRVHELTKNRDILRLLEAHPLYEPPASTKYSACQKSFQ